jgi:hypothetical protein
MPNLAALTINDGQATPAAHTFAVENRLGGKAMWADKAPGISSGFNRITNEVRMAKSKTGANSNITTWELPTLAVIDGTTQRARVSSAQLRINFAQDATDQERKDAYAYIANFLSNATVKAAIIGQEPHY